MTTEAKEWILSLKTDSRKVIYEMESSPEGMKVVLDGERITDEEFKKAIHFAKNGSPEITVEYRNLVTINSPSWLPLF